MLWSAVFILVSTLQRPVEQLLSRVGLRAHRGGPVLLPPAARRGDDPARDLGRRSSLVAIALRGPIEDDLLDGNDFLFWVGVAAVAAYGASYFARGFLAGSHRLTTYAMLIISESVSRTAFPLAVAVGIATGQDAVALGIVAAPTLSLIVVPFAFLRRGAASRTRGGATARARTPSSPREAEFTLAHGGGFAAAVFLIMLSEQAFLNAGPLLVKGTAGRRSRRVHLQHPDDRPGAPPALPGRVDEPPPPPHPPAGRGEPTTTSGRRSP